jgi:hypothetical protein
MKLYSVTTVVDEFCGLKDVEFWWFYCGERTEKRPYEELIENYDPADHHVSYPEECINELFTEDEAAQLKVYLDTNYGDAGLTTIDEAKLPIPANMAGWGANAAGAGVGFCALWRIDDEYSLPFRVTAYYDLIGCEKVDGSGPYYDQWNDPPLRDQRQP